jgi:5-methylcytosine-specific restriction endonuclease McrA
MKTKTCRDCGEEKSLEESFYKKSGRENEWLPYCKPCHLSRGNKNRKANPNTEARRKRNWEDWYSKNKRAKLDYNNAYAKERRKRDPAFKLRMHVSSRVIAAITYREGQKLDSTWNYLPYTPQELKEHLERQFEPWMTWDNHGFGRGCWQMDHVYPHSKLPYDSLDHPNFQKCWALENLQPLCAIKNLKKSDKVLDI